MLFCFLSEFDKFVGDIIVCASIGPLSISFVTICNVVPKNLHPDLIVFWNAFKPEKEGNSDEMYVL